LRRHRAALSDASSESTSARRSGAYASIFALATLTVLALVVPMAKAATPIDSYTYFTSFGSGSSISWPSTYTGVTVEPTTGNIIVAEPGNNEIVSIYAPDATLGGVPLTTFEGHAANVASDPSNGSSYTVSIFGGVTKWLSDGAPTPTYTIDNSFSSPISPQGGIAVDPVTHDVLVTDLVQNVYRLDSVTGAVLSTFDGSDTQAGTFEHAGSIAAGPSGSIYVVDFSRPRVEQMSAAGAALGALPLSEGAKPEVVAVNGQSGEVAVVESLPDDGYWLEGFTPAGDRVYRTRVPSTAAPKGIAVDPTSGRIYLADEAGIVSVFIPAIQPGIDAPVVSQIGADHAHVSATVAAGGETTTARIEYCPATADCASYSADDPDPTNPWILEPDHTLGQTGDPADEETIADDITGLSPNTTYRVRVYAENSLTDNTSATTTFTTAVIPPGVETGPASDVTSSSAILAGTIDTIGDQTTYRFEYGLTAAYGSNAPAGAEGIAGNDRTPRTFTRSIAGLSPGTTYHYRLVARNSAGEAAGADRTFTTLAGDAPMRRYEQVTPVDKRGAFVQAAGGAQAAADGSALAYLAKAAPSDANSAPQASRFMSRRGAAGWSDWNQLDPALAVGRTIVTSPTLAVSADFNHTMVVSNRALTAGGVEQGANIYVVDLRTGAYTLVATSTAPSAFAEMAGLGKNDIFMAAAPDFSWIVFRSRMALLPGVTAPAIYRWSEGDGLTLESRLPDGSIPTGEISPRVQRQVSADGRTTYFALNPGIGGFGVFRRTDGVTTPISVSHRAGDDPETTQLGFLAGSSSDGRYAFFYGLQLTDDAPPAFGNLYRYDSVTDDLTFIATLSFDFGNGLDMHGIGADGETVYYNSGGHTMVWHDGQEHQVDPQVVLHALPSRNGRYLVYQRGLGTGDGDLRLYDLARNETTCISCPVGAADGAGKPRLAFEAQAVDGIISNKVPVVVTDDGLALFDTTARLVAGDHNGTRDVYSYQDGTLTLISPGDQAFSAYYLDASADGSDVFFGTAQALVGRDTDQSIDIYDARVGGGFPEAPPPPPPCQGDACQGEAPLAPEASAPGSAVVTGAGKRKSCPKGKKRIRKHGKATCVKKKHSKHHKRGDAR
jgi:hypothetical protein